MMKRVVTKIGDVFEVKTSKERKKYFQLIAFDLTQLNSDVIRAFDKEYSLDEFPQLSEVVKDKIQFYAHCMTRSGVKLGFWEKVGRSDEIGEVGEIIFRGTEDYATAPGDEPISISDDWYVWRIGDDDFTEVGKLVGENRKAEIGLVFDPASIVHRMKTGEYPYSYPGFE